MSDSESSKKKLVQTTDTAIALLGDKCSSTREAAVDRLGRQAQKGDRRVVVALIGRLGDDCGLVQVAALGMLGHVSEKGDEDVLAAVIARIDDKCSGVREA